MKPTTPEHHALVAARKAICAKCDLNHGLMRVSVKCDTHCGCNATSLLTGTCKLNQWPHSPTDISRIRHEAATSIVQDTKNVALADVKGEKPKAD